MPLDTSIILGARQPQFDMAQFSPMNALAAAAKFKQAEQEGELNALTLNERKNLSKFLPGKNLSDPDVQRRLASEFGEAGRKIAAGVSSIGTAETTEKKRRIDTAVEKSKMYNNALMDVTDQRSALQWIQDQKNDPDMAGSPIANVSILDAASRIPADPAGFAQWKQQAALGLGKYIELNKPVISQVNRGGQTDILSRPGLGGALTTVGNYPDVGLPADVEAQKIRISAASRPVTNVNLPPQEKAFEGELGKGQAKRIIDSQVAAQDAASIIDTVKTGRGIMKSGMITGAGADFLVNFNQGLKTAGIDAGFADAAANSQAFSANMAANVGRLIKQFGAGTGLSDADRQYAEKMAGSKITLDAKALNKILDINEKAARNVIARHNKDVKGIKTNIPLEVEIPSADAAPAAAPVSAPPTAINYLRANPSMKGAFDAKYGAGAADRALKGQ